jgi:small-conductance mechanosensitive channel
MTPLRTTASAAVRSIPDVVFLAVLFFVFRMLLGLTRLFFEAIEEGAVTFAGFQPDWAQPTYRAVRLALIAFALVMAFPYIPGSNSAAFQGVSIFLGVLLSLGSSSAIANIVAGYMLIYRRAFKVGDRIKIGQSLGDVIETRLQVTHLRSPKNEELIIPNSQILSADVVNYSSLARARGLILHTEVGIGYDVSWRQVEAMLLAAADRTPGLLAQPRPFVLEKRLAEFAVIYELNVYCANASAMGRLYAALHRNILDLFNEHGVQIMTPAYEGDPPEPKVVPRERWHATPSRRADE